jgi:hypothetical protein
MPWTKEGFMDEVVRNHKIIIRNTDTGEIVAESPWVDEGEFTELLWAVGKFTSPQTTWKVEIA